MKNHNSCTPEMRVSVKFYNRLRERVASILATLQGSCAPTSFEGTPSSHLGEHIMRLLDAYLAGGNSDSLIAEADTITLTIFYTLKAELDAAIERSHRARAAAAARRHAKALSATPSTPSAIPVPSDNSDLSDNSDNSDNSDLSELSDPSELSELSDLSEMSLPSENFAPSSPSSVPRSRFGLKFRPVRKPGKRGGGSRRWRAR